MTAEHPGHDHIEVPRQRFVDGRFPHACVRTGQPADGLAEVRLASVPGPRRSAAVRRGARRSW